MLIRKVNQTKMYCIDEAVVIIVWVDDCLSSCNILWKRDPAIACLHSICTVYVDLEFENVVEDVSTVSVVILIQALPLNGGDE